MVPADEDLDRAAEVLNAGERGGDAGRPGRAARRRRGRPRSPTLLGAGVAKALLGKAVLPDDLPYVTGSIGLLGTKPSWTLMQECDTLLMVGSSFPYSEFLPEEGKARGVQIDIDGKMLGIRYPMEVNLVGDSAETLRALMPRLERKEDRSWREQIEGEVARVVEADGRPRAARRRPDQSAARLPRALQAPARRRDPHLGLGLVGQLVRPRHQAARGHDGLAVGHAGDDGPGRARTRSRPSSPIPTGR